MSSSITNHPPTGPEVRAIILRAAGINTDLETEYALELAGARADRIHINRLIEDKGRLGQYHILIFPGGFSYGDDVAAGRILANQVVHHLSEPIRRFIDDGKLVLGICNGFQVLVKAGILPGGNGFRQEAVTITYNDSGKYEDRWVYLAPQTDRCVFLDSWSGWRGGVENGAAPLDDGGREGSSDADPSSDNSADAARLSPDVLPTPRNPHPPTAGALLYVPVAHGEGKVVTRDAETLQRLKSDGHVAFKYVDAHGREGPFPVNPNGSVESIAGLVDATGRVLGLMPHPERFVRRTQHPHWSRLAPDLAPDGIRIFHNAVRYVRQTLLEPPASHPQTSMAGCADAPRAP
jgi:phosphoribosylformylglycinamidine (FGAM) synthase-like amidotransferase family enzyme